MEKRTAYLFDIALHSIECCKLYRIVVEGPPSSCVHSQAPTIRSDHLHIPTELTAQPAVFLELFLELEAQVCERVAYLCFVNNFVSLWF